MKSMMWKTTLREIKQSMGRYLAILAIVALGVGFFAGVKETKPMMVETANCYFNETLLYDYRLLCTLGFDEKIVEDIRARADVQAVQGAYSFDILSQNTSDGNMQVLKAHSITEGVNELRVLYGRLPEKSNECVVDSGKYSKKYIGKKIKLSDTNEKKDLEHFAHKEYKIVGIVESPLYVQFERGTSSLGNGKINSFIYLQPEGFCSEAYTEVYVKLVHDYYLYEEAYDTFIRNKDDEWQEYIEELGKKRYEIVRKEGEQKLEDAKQELLDAKKDAETKFADAKAELDDAFLEIEDGKEKLAEAKREMIQGRETIAKEEIKLENALRTIARNEKLLLEKEKELEEGIKQWEKGNQELFESKSQLATGNGIITTQEDRLLEGEQQLAEKEKELIKGEEQFAQMDKIVRDGLAALEKREAKLDRKEQEWKDSQGEIPVFVKEQIDAERKIISAAKQPLLDSSKELEQNRQKLLDGRKQLEQAKEQLKNGRKQLDDAKEQAKSGQNMLAEGEKELELAWSSIKDGRKQISEGRKQLLKARQDTEEGKRMLQDAKEELVLGEQELNEKEQELLEGEQEYLEGVKEYEEGLADYEKEIADAEAKIEDAQQKLREITMPDNFLLGRNTNVGYVLFKSDSDIVENISTVFPVFFFLVAALVCMTTMSRMIEEQRTQIGTLKALGYSKGAIMGKYMIYSGSAAILGCVGGYILGIILFPNVIWMCYGMMYDMGKLCFVFNGKLAGIALAVSLLCSVGTTWYSCRKELNEVSAQLMRPKTPQAGKRILLERIPLIWNRLKFLQKVSIRNVFRYKKRFFMMVLGISGCAALVLAALGIKDSIADVMKMQYEEIQIYDMSIMLNNGLEEAEFQNIEECLASQVMSSELILETTMDLVTDSGTKSLKLVSCENMEQLPKYIDMHTMKGQNIRIPGPGEGVISHKIAEKYELHVGDTITVQDKEYHNLEVTISGIMQNFVSNYLYIHPETYTMQMQKKPEFKNMYINVREETDMHQLSASLMKMDDVMGVTVNETERERFETMMSTLDYVVILVLVCAAALAFIVIYNLTNINITERIREIATIKVLGFYQKETATYVFRENIILTLVGALVGLLLGKILHTFIMECIQVDMVSFDIRILPMSYLYSVVITMFFAICVNKLMAGKLNKISMTESLKSVD